MQARARQVAVVGAGLAGLACAWSLARRGLGVTVFEREARAGGRAWSESREGFRLEPLSPVVSSADAELLAWIAEVGVADELLPLRPVVTALLRAGRVEPFDPRRVLDFARTGGVAPHQALRLVRLPRLMRRYGTRLDPARPECAGDLDDRSVADFARLYFGRTLLERWMEPLVAAESLGDAADASRVHFLLRYRRHFGSRAGLPRGPLSDLADAASARLVPLLGADVRAVEPRPGGGIAIAYVREGRERLLEVDAAVLATPARDAARIGRAALATGEREALEGIRYAPSVVLAVATFRPFWSHPQEIRIPRAEGLAADTLLLEAGVPGGRVPDGCGCITLRAGGAAARRALDLADDGVEKELLPALDRVQPGARNAVELTRVFRVDRARPRFDVGHYRALARLARIGDERRAEGRRVYLAGDYRIDPSWGGAVESGRRVARAVAQDLR